jgi:RNA polymerase sigma-70 factor (ECF subfamily)
MRALTPLLLRAADGDRAALTEVIRSTQADVWRLCAYLTSRDDADDLTQETYARMCTGLHRVTPETDGRAWLLGIARHVAIDHVRRAARWRRVEARIDAPGDQPSTAGHTDLQLLLQRLDPDRRAAFVLTQVLGLPYEEAAAVCGCPVGTIRSRVARARAQLVDEIDTRAAESG